MTAAKHPSDYRPNNPHGPGFRGRSLAGDAWEMRVEWHHARRVILLTLWRHRRTVVAIWLVTAFLVGSWSSLWDHMPWAVTP